MDFLRSLVSMQKTRYAENGFNLDLTYITPRTIAMAFPADGLESLYRNRIDDVARLLDLNHKDKYLVFNASNRLYDEAKFFNRVRSMNWPNHYPCPLEHFISMLIEALEFLLQDPSHAVIVHCLAGKGRTGSFLNALHFATGQFPSIAAANQFYLSKRGVHVTYGSQLRYLDYFVRFYQQGPNVLNFQNKSVEKVQFRSRNRDFISTLNYNIRFFDFSKDDFQLAEGLFVGGQFQETDGDSPNGRMYYAQCTLSPWRDSQSLDVMINVRVNGLVASKLFRANFSMLAVDGDQLTLAKHEIDKAKGVPADFEMVLFFTRFAVTKEGEQRREKFTALHEKLCGLRTRIDASNLRESMFGEEAVRASADK